MNPCTIALKCLPGHPNIQDVFKSNNPQYKCRKITTNIAGIDPRSKWPALKS